MEMEPRMPHQPRFHSGMFVSSVIVDDQMQVNPHGRLAIDLFEEPNKVLMSVARHTIGILLDVDQMSEKRHRLLDTVRDFGNYIAANQSWTMETGIGIRRGSPLDL